MAGSHLKGKKPGFQAISELKSPDLAVIGLESGVSDHTIQFDETALAVSEPSFGNLSKSATYSVVGMPHGYVPAASVTGEIWTGTDADESHTGTNLDDVLNGGGGNDTLNGGDGDDTLDGGDFAGTRNRLVGGAGNDTYYVYNTGDVVVEADGAFGVDRIITTVDYALPTGVEILEVGATTKGLNLTGRADGNDTIIGGSGNDTINGAGGWDELYGGAGNDVYFAIPTTRVIEAVGGGWDEVYFSGSGIDQWRLEAGSEIEVVRTLSNSYIVGNEFATHFIGGNGTDVFDGGLDTAVDTLAGGKGSDTYILRSAGDIIIENPGEGRDTIRTQVDCLLDPEVSVEEIYGDPTGGAKSFHIRGSKYTEVIVIDGGVTNDTLESAAEGSGVLVMSGSGGDDVYYVHRPRVIVMEDAGGGSDIVYTDYSFTLFSDIETLQASEGFEGITLTGNSNANTIIGNKLANTLVGGGGLDTLKGGAGDDVYVVTDALAKIVELEGEGKDTILTSVSYTLAPDVEIEVLQATGTAAINLTGNRGSNEIIGNSANNVLDGGDDAVADTLAGGLGNDTYYVRAGDIVKENADEGTDTVIVYESYTLDGGASIEVLQADTSKGTTEFSLKGNEVANTIIGALGNDSLDGGGSASDPADLLIGGDGDDTYYVHRASDRVVEGSDAASGSDRIITDVSYTIATNVESLQAAAGIDGIVLTGNGVANTLIGNERANTLIGAGGEDTLKGGSGDDVYVVTDTLATIVELEGEGKDTILTSVSYTLAPDAEIEVLRANGAGAIDLTGNRYKNEIIGNDAANVLDGGRDSEADTLTGGKGDDVYHLRTGDIVNEIVGEGHDTAVVYSSYTLNGGASLEVLQADQSEGTSDFSLKGNELANTIIGASGNDTLDGGGTTDGPGDSLVGGDGDDTYYVRRANDVVVEGAGGGNDIIITSVDLTIAANVETLQAAAGAGDLVLTGNAAANTLIGNEGDNVLRGGGGADTMRGGLGDDFYYVDSSDDVVEDEGEGYDTVIVTFAGDYTLTENSHVEELRARTGVAVGKLTGNSQRNIIIADAGDNTLDGGGGGDVLQGGVGNDVYVVRAGDKIVEKDGEGTDTAIVDASYKLEEGLSIEVLQAGVDTGIALTGNSFANTLIGARGNDTLDGGKGDDVLRGGKGDDTYLVNDTGTVVEEAFGEGFDTVVTSVSFSLKGIENVEALTAKAGAGSIRLTGNSLANLIKGNEGNNMIDGGLGADTAEGGKGDDVYLVDNEGDVVNEAADEGFDTIIVTTAIDYALKEGSSIEELRAQSGVAVGRLTGNSLSNIIIADVGDNTLDGGAGADILKGGAGNDTYIVDNINDQVVETSSNGGDAGGIDTVITSVDFTLGAYVENLKATGSGNLVLTGNALSNIIEGNGGNDTIDGGGTGAPGEGNDILRGGGGNDVYILRHAGDTVEELAGGGTDTVRVSFDYTLGAEIEVLEANGDAGYRLSGNALNNTITGSTGADTLQGGGGNDVLDGKGGVNTAVFSGLSADYVISKNADGSYTVVDTQADRDGSDILKNIRFIQFGDGTVLDLGQPLNTSPTAPATVGAVASVNEHTASDTVVAQVLSTDDYSAVSYSLVDDLDGRFSIDPTTGVITVHGAVDFETEGRLTLETGTGKKYFTVQVVASDGSLTSSTTSIKIYINDVNERPTTPVVTGVVATVDENKSGSTDVAQVQATDQDYGQTLTYSLVDTLGGRFSIDAATGVITLNGAVDFETATGLTLETGTGKKYFTVQVVASDGSLTSTTTSIKIYINDVNERPTTPVVMGVVATVDENKSGSTNVAQVQATDQDYGQTLTYSLVDTLGGRFSIDAATGVITLNGAVDFETATGLTLEAGTGKKYFTVQVVASDGTLTSAVTPVKIYINDVDEKPSAPSYTGMPSVDENTNTGDVLVQVGGAVDPEGTGVTYDFAAGGNPGGRFVISADGKITLAGSVTLDYEATDLQVDKFGKFYTVQVVAKDPASQASSATDVKIYVGNVNEAPTAAVYTAGAAINETAGRNTLVGTLSGATDPDGTTPGYVFADTGTTISADEAFKIVLVGGVYQVQVNDPSKIQVTTGSSQTFSYAVRATDGSAQSATATTVSVVVNDVSGLTNTAPTLSVTGPTSFTAKDTGEQATPFAGVTVVDGIEDDTLTLTISFANAHGDLVLPATLPDDLTVSWGVLGGGMGDPLKVYTFTGKAGTLTTFLGNLKFDPANRPDATSGSTETTGFTLTVKDGAHTTPVSGGIDTSLQVVTDITDKSPPNGAPTGPTLEAAPLSEYAKAGTVVGTLSATDPDGPITYSLTGGAIDLFAIDGNKIVLKAGVNYEVAKSHTITVVATDSKDAVSTASTFNIDIRDETNYLFGTNKNNKNLIGTDLDDAIYGRKGNDTIKGGAGDDKLYGEDGKDKLYGGAGIDAFVFTKKLNKETNVDTIADFTVGEDQIWLDNAIFKKLGALGSEAAPLQLNAQNFSLNKARDKNDYIIYKKGVLYYDADGSGKGEMVEIAKLSKKVLLTAKDIFIV
ncbi:cadherin domain-containing protein [Microvirga flavescens]|uniref:cadherin domain-containing protein n=1 Tax=Microvirga flavescens TaxID=2249811 RepID=UPI000DD52B56|nr:cadherin domain-containing protein [Microvirga flavescens]